MTGGRACWCGNTDLLPFDDAYGRCAACETLVLRRATAADAGRVTDDEADFYGRDYWFAHQVDDLGHVNLVERARRDLGERCLHWLRALLSYRLPPARVLELGSAHGGFVFLLSTAGFEATGLELSPSIVEFASRTFGLRMLTGPLEEQAIPHASLGVIAAMDVIEHLRDPVATLSLCTSRLELDGLLLLQTPCYVEGTSAEALHASDSPFLVQLKPSEHLYLFSRTSLRRLLVERGLEHVEFLPAIFAHYDMFVAASRRPLQRRSEVEIAEALAATPGGRLVQALLDKDAGMTAAVLAREASWQERLDAAEADRAARLAVIEAQGREMASAEAELKAWRAFGGSLRRLRLIRLLRYIGRRLPADPSRADAS